MNERLIMSDKSSLSSIMVAQSSESKVALLDHISVGKTTVLNVLFQDKFNEFSKKRPTAGINYVHVLSLERASQKRKGVGINNFCVTVGDVNIMFVYSNVVYIPPKEMLNKTISNFFALHEKNAIQEKFLTSILMIPCTRCGMA